MVTMNISLPTEMKRWVESQAKNGRYGNTSDFMRDLVRREQERQSALDQLGRLLDEGFQSGPSPHSMDEIFERARQMAAARAPGDA